MRSSALALLVACGTPPPVAKPAPVVVAPSPPRPPEHLASVTPPVRRAAARCDQPDLSKLMTSANVVGAVCDAKTREWLQGVTVIIEVASGRTETAITDENGLFAIPLPQGTYRITFYYADLTQSRELIVGSTESFIVEALEQ
jgi:hypothetical protein